MGTSNNVELVGCLCATLAININHQWSIGVFPGSILSTLTRQWSLLPITSQPGSCTPGWSICKILKLSAANEIAHEKFGWLPVTW